MNRYNLNLLLRRGKETDSYPSHVKALNNSEEITDSHHGFFILVLLDQSHILPFIKY